MKATKRVSATLLFVIAMFASLFTATVPAHASSAYDGYLQVASTLEVYTNSPTNTTIMDISSTWWRDYKQSYAKRVAQGIGWPTNFATTFESYVANGGSYGVIITDNTAGRLITIAATDDPHATCAFSGPLSTDSYRCTVHAGYGLVKSEYFTHYSYGGNGCIFQSQSRCSTNGMNIYTAPTVTAASGSSYRALSLPNNGTTKAFIMNFDHTYPSGYAGAIMPSTKHTTADYVAMGDSFSSGEGNPSFEPGSNVMGINACHRSLNYAYPRVITSDVSLGLSNISFVACSGATTDDLLNGGPVEAAQIDALSSSTDAVTLTIGGNDMGFVEVLTACSNQFAGNNGWGCSADTTLNNDLDDRLDALAGTAATTVYEPNGDEIHSILEVIETIATEAPNASIYIAGYPSLFGPSSTYYDENEDAPGDAVCVADVGVNFSYEDAQWINGRGTSLNTVISDAVTDAQNESIDVTYVSPSIFNGHALCDSDTSYLYGVVLDSAIPNPLVLNPGSMHPTATGAGIGYGTAFQYAMS